MFKRQITFSTGYKTLAIQHSDNTCSMRKHVVSSCRQQSIKTPVSSRGPHRKPKLLQSNQFHSCQELKTSYITLLLFEKLSKPYNFKMNSWQPFSFSSVVTVTQLSILSEGRDKQPTGWLRSNLMFIRYRQSATSFHSNNKAKRTYALLRLQLACSMRLYFLVTR